MTIRNFQKTRIKGKARRDRVKGKDGAGFGRALLDLKLEHIIIMQALEDANRSHERAVGVAEIAERISPRDKKKLEKT